MAIPGQYLVNNTVNDCNALLAQLEQARRLVTRVTERMEAIGRWNRLLTALELTYLWNGGAGREYPF